MQEIPREQVLKHLRSENPWWEPPHELPEQYASLSPRPYIDLLFPLASSAAVRRAVVLLGPRRVGKTVLIHHVIGRLLGNGVEPARICYASIDHPLYNNLSLDDLVACWLEATGIDPRAGSSYLFLDEIQYMADWEKYLKSLVDRRPALVCTASGSAAAALRLKSNESGAGRFTDFMLPPLTFHEYLVLKGVHDLVEIVPSSEMPALDCTTSDITTLNRHFVAYLNFGGYPEVVLSPTIQKDPARFIKNDIIDKVLLRDLPSLYGITNIQELNSLFTTLAYNSACEVSLEALSQHAGVAKNTIRRYIEYLEAAFLIKVVRRVDHNAKTFKRAHAFKVYLTNPSIRCALFSPITQDDAAIGQMTETAVFSQWFHFQQATDQLHYARWKDGEVDIVCLDPSGRPSWAIEAKYSDRVTRHPEELSGLLSFCRKHELESTWVTTLTESSTRIIRTIETRFLPASLYCFMVGYNIVLGQIQSPQDAADSNDREIEND
jgi:predicted AAA+ superfamily ATPase